MGAEIVGAVLFCLGMAVGRVLRLRSRPQPMKPIQPICGCGHHFSLHDPDTKQCHGSLDEWGDPVNLVSKLYPCACRQYSGPEPLPTYFAPEIGA